MKSVFSSTEVNLISSRQLSGLSPWDKKSGPVGDIIIPANFFLNLGLIAGGGPGGYKGLGLDNANVFKGLGVIPSEIYSDLISTNNLILNRQSENYFLMKIIVYKIAMNKNSYTGAENEIKNDQQ